MRQPVSVLGYCVVSGKSNSPIWATNSESGNRSHASVAGARLSSGLMSYSCGQLKSTNWGSQEPDFLAEIWWQFWNRTGKRSSKMVFSCHSHEFLAVPKFWASFFASYITISASLSEKSCSSSSSLLLSVRIQKSDQTGDWTQAFWTYTRCSNHWAIQPCWVQSYNELYVSATPNHGY